MNFIPFVSIFQLLTLLQGIPSAFSSHVYCLSTLHCPYNSICLWDGVPDWQQHYRGCECRHGYYEDDNGGCTKIIGSPCTNNATCDGNTTRGYCTTNNTCGCQPGLVLHSHLSICINKPTKFFDVCSVTEDCDNIPNAICSNNKCVCNAQTHFLNIKTKRCQPLPERLGASCTLDGDCSKLNHTICQSYEDELPSADSWGTCRCMENFVQIGSTCKGPCQSHNDCLNDEFCDLNVVACRPKFSYGSFCNTTIECASQNVICADLMSNGIMTCNCPVGYLPDRPQNDPELNCIEILQEGHSNCSATDSYGHEWQAIPGEIKAQSCPPGKTGSVTWICQNSGQFQGSTPNYNNCTTPWIAELENQLHDLMGENNSIIVENATIFMSSIKSHVDLAFIDDNNFESGQNTETQFLGHEIQPMVEMLNIIISNVTVSAEEGDPTAAFEAITQETMKVTNTLLNFVKPWNQLTRANRTRSFTNILSLINRSGFQLSTRVKSIGSGSAVEKYLKEHDTKSFMVESGFSQPENLRHFPSDGGRKKGKDSFIQLPSNWQSGETSSIQRQENGETSSVLHVGMDMGIHVAKANIPSQIIDVDEQRVDSTKSMNGDLLGFKGGNEDNTIEFQGDERIYVTFKHDSDAWGDTPKKIPRRLHEGEKPRAASGTTECVYFDEEHQMWSSSGCQIAETSTYSTTCSCSRSGFFGVTTQFHEYVGKAVGLEIVTIFFPVVASLTEIILIKRSKPNGLEGSVQSVMIATFAVNNLLLTGFVDRNLFNISENWCYFVGLKAHFITLASFILFVSLSIKSYLKVSPINGVNLPKYFQDKKLLSYMIVCFGISAIIVITTVLVGVASGTHSRIYGGDFCWLDGNYIWALFAPGIIAIIINFSLMYFINHSTTELSNSDTEDNLPKQKRSKKSIQNNLGFSILLGVTWLVGYYQLGPQYSDVPVLQYLFPLLFAVQAGYLYWFENDIKSFYDLIPSCFKKGESNEDDKKDEKLQKKVTLQSNSASPVILHKFTPRRSEKKHNSDSSETITSECDENSNKSDENIIKVPAARGSIKILRKANPRRNNANETTTSSA